MDQQLPPDLPSRPPDEINQREISVTSIGTLIVTLNRYRDEKPRIFFVSLITVFVIILDGAILFFVLVSGFDYLDKSSQLLILEVTIHIINVIFTMLILIEFPFRCLNVINGISITIGKEILFGEIYFANYPLDNSCLLTTFLMFNVLKICHAPIQCMIQYMLVYYSFIIKEFNALPPTFGYLVAVSLTLGASIGIGEIVVSTQCSSIEAISGSELTTNSISDSNSNSNSLRST